MTRVYLSLLLSLLLPLRSRRLGQLPPILFLVLIPAAFLVANTTLPLTGHVLDPTTIDDASSAPIESAPEVSTPLAPLDVPPTIATEELLFPQTPIEVVQEPPSTDVPSEPVQDVANDQPIVDIPVEPSDTVDTPTESVTEPTEPAKAELKVTLQLPSSIARGSSFPVFVVIENVGTAEAVRIRPRLVLPVGFSATETSGCHALSPRGTCTYTADIATTKDAEAGVQDISVEVAYA